MKTNCSCKLLTLQVSSSLTLCLSYGCQFWSITLTLIRRLPSVEPYLRGDSAFCTRKKIFSKSIFSLYQHFVVSI